MEHDFFAKEPIPTFIPVEALNMIPQLIFANNPQRQQPPPPTPPQHQQNHSHQQQPLQNLQQFHHNQQTHHQQQPQQLTRQKHVSTPELMIRKNALNS